MPLHVYMYAKPPDKVVRINDAYFLANTKLEDTEQCRRILRIIDQAEYCSEKTFIGRDKSLGALFTDNLSTGTKTLLNISQHRDLCFDTIECGNNALTLLMGFTEGQAVLHPGEFCRIAAEQLREKLPPALNSYSDEEIVDNYKNLLE